MNSWFGRAARGIKRSIFLVANDPNDKSNECIEHAEFLCYINKRVTRAEIWECPVENHYFLQLVGVVHQGIVVTMESGCMLLVHKLPQEEEEGKGDVVVAHKSNMEENWSLVQGKDIQSAKLRDYLEKCGIGFNIITDSTIHAVERMWSLD